MKTTIALIIGLILTIFSISLAGDVSLKKAYSLYFQGRMKEAVKIMEDYVEEHPDPRVLYFIGYAYYELKEMDKARKYFEKAYLIDPDFSPLPLNKQRDH